MRSRAQESGVKAMRDEELIALVLRSPEEAALEAKGALGDLAALAKARPEEVRFAAKGVGLASALALCAALELADRLYRQKKGRKSVTCPQEAYEALAPVLAGQRQECFAVLLLNAKCRALCTEIVAMGTLSACAVDARGVFRLAVARSAHSVILAHNHPSNDPLPSREDEEVTAYLKGAGDGLGVKVRDHIIIADGSYYSFSEGFQTAL